MSRAARAAPRGPRPPTSTSLKPSIKRLIQELAKIAVAEELERQRNTRNTSAK